MKFISNLSAIMLFAFLILTGCTQTATTQQNAEANVAKEAMSVPPQPKAETEDDMKRISVEEAKAAFDSGKAFFIDTRDAEAYKAEHIKGAVNIMANEIQDRYKQLPTDKQIIVYCS